jgi:hypothetical protein
VRDELNVTSETLELQQRGRREVLAKLGLYGAVSAPILVGVLKAEKAVAQTVGIPGDCDPGDPGSCF